MTREEIAKSLKPIEWDTWGPNLRFAEPIESYEARIRTRIDGNLLIQIHEFGSNRIEVSKEVNTMQEATDLVREWQINKICDYFEMNN
jgi:hypothetical protein